MSKELEALQRIKYKLSSTKANGYWEDLDIIETALERNAKFEKFVKICKTKQVAFELICEALEDNWLDDFDYAIFGLTKEEFNLIKEILEEK